MLPAHRPRASHFLRRNLPHGATYLHRRLQGIWIGGLLGMLQTSCLQLGQRLALAPPPQKQALGVLGRIWTDADY